MKTKKRFVTWFLEHSNKIGAVLFAVAFVVATYVWLHRVYP
jgi:hypothetical protein